MGAAAIATALWKYSMRYNPSNPDWINRDRESGFCFESKGLTMGD